MRIDSRGLSAGALLAVSLLVACDYQVGLHGKLTSSTGKPVTVGEVRVECPRLCAYAVVHDEDGGFSGFEWGRGCPTTCKLRIASVGHQTLVAPADHFCTERRGSECSDYEVKVELQAASTGVAGP